MKNQEISPKNKETSGREYYRYALANLIKMGHCAPTVMQTILDISSEEQEWLVRLSAGRSVGKTTFQDIASRQYYVHPGFS